MADVFTNDLRIREQEVGANSGQWGSLLNVSLENIAESWSYGTEALADSAAQTLTLADGASDQLRSFYVKLTGTLSQATTVTIAPNTISKSWMIENATTGGYAVTISQGSGANVTVSNGNVKMVATDGAGAGAVVYDLFTDLELAGGLTVPGETTMSDSLTVDPADGVADEAYALTVRNQEATAGRNYGAWVRGGSNSSDESFSVRKFDNSATYFKVRGDGKIGIGTTAPTRSLSISGTGSQYINVVSANDSGAGLLLGDTDAEIRGAILYDNSAETLQLRSGGNTTAVTIDSSQNVGIGVTPSGSWDANIDALQIGEQSMLWSGDTDYTDATWVGTNVYQSGGATKYLTTGVASVYGMQNGQHYWYTYASGSADATVSGNEVMSINASGNVTILGDMTGTGDTKFLATGDIGIGPRQGTATSGAVYIGGNTDNPFVSPTAIFTGDGKVGIAQTDPKEKLNVAGAGLFEGDHATAVNAMGSTAGIMLHASSPNVFVSATSNGSDNRNMQLRALNAGSSNANQIFLEYTGNVGIGTGTPGTSRLYVSANSDGAFAQYILQDHSGGYGMGVRSDSGAMIYFYIGGTYQGHIYSSGGATTYGQGSDYRLKDNVVGMSGSIDNLKKLRPVTFNFKADEDSLPQQGFIAHEAQEVVPGAVTGQKDDPIDEEKQIGYQSMDYGKVTPLLTSALQEAIARIETLEAEVKALKEA